MSKLKPGEQFEDLIDSETLSEEEMAEDVGGSFGGGSWGGGGPQPNNLQMRMSNMAATIQSDENSAGTFMKHSVSNQQIWNDVMEDCHGSAGDNHGQSDNSIVAHIEEQTGICKALGEQSAFEQLSKASAFAEGTPLTSTQIMSDVNEAVDGLQGLGHLKAGDIAAQAVSQVEATTQLGFGAANLRMVEAQVSGDESTVDTLMGGQFGQGVGNGLGAELSGIAAHLKDINSNLSAPQLDHDVKEIYELQSGIASGLIAGSIQEDIVTGGVSSDVQIGTKELMGQINASLGQANFTELVNNTDSEFTTIKTAIEVQDNVINALSYTAANNNDSFQDVEQDHPYSNPGTELANGTVSVTNDDGKLTLGTVVDGGTLAYETFHGARMITTLLESLDTEG